MSERDGSLVNKPGDVMEREGMIESRLSHPGASYTQTPKCYLHPEIASTRSTCTRKGHVRRDFLYFRCIAGDNVTKRLNYVEIQHYAAPTQNRLVVT